MTNSQSKITNDKNIKFIQFFFTNNELYVAIADGQKKMVDVLREIWNECVVKIVDDDTISNEDKLGESAVEFGERVSEIKQLAIPFGQFGFRVIQEITRLGIQHLELVIAESKKNAKRNRGTGKSGIIQIEIK